MCLRVEQADECGNEPIVRQDFGEPVVDFDKSRRQIGTELERHPQHRVHLRHRKRRGNAVSGCISQDDQQSSIDER